MSILNYYLQPELLDINDPENLKRNADIQGKRLSKNRQRKIQRNCPHFNLQYEKWVHKGRKAGVKDSFHYKSFCKDCGKRQLVQRTKRLYELLKNEVWHYKKS